MLDHRSENGKAASVKIHLQHAEPVFKSRQTLTQQVFQKKVFAEAAEPVPVNPVISETEKLTVNTEVPVSKSLQLQNLPEATPLPAGNDAVSVKPPVADNIPVPDFTRQVVFKELDTDDDRKSLYLGSLEINKDKLRGLFRKAGNFFRSKTRQLPEEEISEVNRASSSRTLK